MKNILPLFFGIGFGTGILISILVGLLGFLLAALVKEFPKDIIFISATIAATLISPIMALIVSERLREVNYAKRNRDELVQKLIRFSYQLANGKPGKEIIEALNEIKYVHSNDPSIKEQVFELLSDMSSGKSSHSKLIKLIQHLANKEGHRLTFLEIEKVFIIKE